LISWTAVGAVYDRATFENQWAKCAVIDRAYRRTRYTEQYP